MFDLLIIGAGAIGTTIARTMAKYDLKIALLDKNPEVAQETTKANSAIVHAGYDAAPGTLKAKLNVRGNQLMPALSEELGFSFVPTGSLVLAFDEEQKLHLEKLLEQGQINGVPELSIITGDEARQIENRISAEVKYALYAKTAGVVDPFNYAYAMAENAITNGVSFFPETKVIGVKQSDGQMVLETTKGDFQTRFVVNAAGLYADQIARMFGDDDFKIKPTKGVYRLLDKSKNEYIHTVLFQVPTDKGKGILVTPTYDGNTMLGPTAEPIEDPDDTSTEQASLREVDSKARLSVPHLDLSKTIRVFTGVRAKPDTGDFMIYVSKKAPSVVHCGGIESPGLASAPAIGEMVEKLLLAQGLEASPNPNYAPRREAIPRVSLMTVEERAAIIKKNPKFGKIICRCEMVSEAEIVEAIHRPAGAVTVDGVKRRVRAGMGRCQGGFCGPRVIEILARELEIDITEVKKDLSGSEIIDHYLKGGKPDETV